MCTEYLLLELKTELHEIKNNVKSMDTQINGLIEENKKLKNIIDTMNTEIDIGDYVKIPKNIKYLVICGYYGGNSVYDYFDKIPIKKNWI